MRRGKRLLGLALAVAGFAGQAGARGAGDTAASFLHLAGEARAAALGGSYAGLLGEDRAPLGWNPAGLGGVRGISLGLTHLQWLGDVTYDAASFTAGVSSRGALGTRVVYLRSGEIIRTLEDPLMGTFDRETGAFHNWNAAVTMGYGQVVGAGVRAGLAATYVGEGVDGRSDGAIGGDLGVHLGFGPGDAHSIALSVQNAGSSLGGSSLPVLFRAGLGLRCLPGRALGLLGEARYVVETERLSAGAGTELWLGQRIALRAGYRHADAGDLSRGATAGIGLRWPQWGVDYAYAPTPQEFAPAHRVTASYVWTAGSGHHEARRPARQVVAKPLPPPPSPSTVAAAAPPPAPPSPPPVVAAAPTPSPRPEPPARVEAPRPVAQRPAPSRPAVEFGWDTAYLSTQDRYSGSGKVETSARETVSELRVPISLHFTLVRALGIRMMVPYVARDYRYESGGSRARALSGSGFGDAELGLRLAPRGLTLAMDAILPTGTSYLRSSGSGAGLGSGGLWTGGPMIGAGAGPAVVGGWYGLRPSIRMCPDLGWFDFWLEGSYTLTMPVIQESDYSSYDYTTGKATRGTLRWTTDPGDPIRVGTGMGFNLGGLTLGAGLEQVVTGVSTVAYEGAFTRAATSADSGAMLTRALPELRIRSGFFKARLGAAISLMGANEVAGTSYFGGLSLGF